jgi:hypothetical protein
MKNMNKQFRKIDFEQPAEEQVNAAASSDTQESGRSDQASS